MKMFRFLLIKENL